MGISTGLVIFNLFTLEFMKWTLPSLNLDTFIVTNTDFSHKSTTEWQTVDPDGTAHYKPFHLDLHCLQGYLYWSAEMKGLILSH